MITAETDRQHCGCRSVGECTHNIFLELENLNRMVDSFAEKMKEKLRKKYMAGRTGWDDPSIKSNLEQALVEHVYKGDMVDVANFAAMIWNIEQP